MESMDTRPASSHRSQRGFWALIVTQFQGAFSENILKTLVVFLIAGMGLAPAERDRFVLIVGACFSMPFILFSMLGGNLADRYSKRAVTIWTKIFALAVMVFALVALAMNKIYWELAAVFLASTPAALFGPSKYGLLPELLPEKKLSWGNGVIELGTFAAIIFGTAAGAAMAEHFHGRQIYSGATLVVLAVIGLSTSFGITRVPAADPAARIRLNFIADLVRIVREMKQDEPLFMALLASTYFFFLGALINFNIVFYGSDVLHIGESKSAVLLSSLGIGIGTGSMVAGLVSRNKIEYGLIPLGSIGMAVFGFTLFNPHLQFHSIAWLLAGLGFFGGFFIVPVNAVLQHRPADDKKGGVLAAANLLSFVGIFGASLIYFLLTSSAKLGPVPLPHLRPETVFLVSGVFTLFATIYIVMLLPHWLVRLVLWAVTNTIYRIRVVGRDNIPEKGGALFVCNHLSFVDALLLTASTDRFIRFIMFADIYNHPLVHPLAKLGRAIPISSALRPRDMIKSLREASETINNGGIVCIFAEGQITRIGQMLPFRRGMERIMKGISPESTAPIVPVHLDGVWGSIFSFEKGRFLWKLPRKIPYPVTISFGKPMPASSTPFEVRQAVQELHSNAYALHKKFMKPLHRRFIGSARRHPFRFAMADGRTEDVKFFAALTKTIFLARRLRKVWAGQKMVGILLPPSVGGALVNLAALMLGKVPVNLNYTASNESLASVAKQCDITTVITSQAFLEKVPLEVPGEKFLLEEVGKNPGGFEKLAALFMAACLPKRILELALDVKKKVELDDLATVIFSSGSTGEPKGVMLSHYNIGSNIEQMGQIFSLGGQDRILGILPFFHSFGFTGTLCLPSAMGLGAVYHPSPLDARVIGALTQKYAATFLLATPTFLQAYIRRCEPEDFGSLQYVMAGAEKLPERVAQAFEDRFGIRPYEGYGATECAPVVSVNARDFRAPGFRQVGAKRGKIGHPLPGVSVRIVHVDTGDPVPMGEPGLLLVKGPNVMVGYLGNQKKTDEVLQDGWYHTGDIATVDEDGFLSIADRLSRFSKIGGEMVPHIKVEEKLHEVMDLTEQKFVVAGVPDEKKGERLIVLHTLSDEQAKEAAEKLAQTDLPALWRPRANQFVKIEAIPYLGTGKLDLRKIKELAAQAANAEEATA
jgi:acyl-[acyl-carrier-protein]-phospholipid O-acyltransferase / long-chain-fatty-acid--[acyl-carrier-protein] ligase